MHRIMPTMRSVLLGAAAAAIFVTTTYGQITIRRARQRGQPLHRDAERLGAPEDAVG